MNKNNKELIKYLVFLIIGILIGLFLLNEYLQPSSTISNTTGNCGDGITTTTPTIEGDRICTKVCLPKPDDCRRPCPTGTHWECGGTLAMTCGCVRDLSSNEIHETPIPDTETGLRGCLSDPSICISSEGWFCDTAINQCVRVI